MIICQFVDLQHVKNIIIIAKNIMEMARNIKKTMSSISIIAISHPQKIPQFRKNIQNFFQEGCKPDTCQPRVSVASPGAEYGM